MTLKHFLIAAVLSLPLALAPMGSADAGGGTRGAPVRYSPGARALIKQRAGRGTIQRAAFRRNLLGPKANTAERVRNFFATNPKARGVTEYLRLLDDGKSVQLRGETVKQETGLVIGDYIKDLRQNMKEFGVLVIDGAGRV